MRSDARLRLARFLPPKNHTQLHAGFSLGPVQDFRQSLESINFEIGKDSFTDINPREKSDKRKIKDAIRKSGRDNGEDAAAIPDISLETGLSEDLIEEVLTYEDNQDEFVNPKGDLWQAL